MENDKTTQARPGRQTSEYWIVVIISILIIGGGVAAILLGKLNVDRAMELITYGLSILGAGYAGSRGLSKMGPLKSLLPLLLLPALLLTMGCAPKTFGDGLAYVHKGLKVMSAVHEAMMRKECRQLAAACKGKVQKPEECTPWIRCRDVRRDINAALITMHQGIKGADKGYRFAQSVGLLKGQ
jgi:hypothetical protein